MATPSTTDETDEQTTQETEEERTEDSQEGSTEEREDDQEEESPEDRIARIEAELAKVRQEAAERRVANRELKDKLASAKTEDDIKAATSEYEEKVARLERQILVRDAADKYNLPPALRDRLKGDTAEDLDKDAEALAALLPKGPEFDEEDLGGGLGGNHSRYDDSEDVREAVRRARRGR